MELNKLTAADAGGGIRCGDFTSEELVRACLDRIAEREPQVQAWAHLDEDFALEQARAMDAMRRSGRTLSPLHGVPVGIKDIMDTKDLPTENGTSIFAGRRPTADASVVRQLKAAGAVILGKTVTTELAFFGPGKTRNPHNLGHTPGGSSSGSAAAVADYHVPLALGTQTAGSVLRPASYCGCIGWKPTFGRISRTGVLTQSPPLDTIGVFARSIEDIALATDFMRTADPSDVAMGPRRSELLLAEVYSGPRMGSRLAFVKSPAWAQGEEAMKQALAKFIAELGPGRVVEVELPTEFSDTGGLQRAVQFRDIARNYGLLADAHPGVVSSKLAEVIAEGRSVTDEQYASALSRRETLYPSLAPMFEAFDAILTPAAPGPAPSGLGSTGSPAFNFLWTYLAVPAVSLPLIEAGGLPLGVQLVAARDKDAQLLNLSEYLVKEMR